MMEEVKTVIVHPEFIKMKENHKIITVITQLLPKLHEDFKLKKEMDYTSMVKILSTKVN